MKPDPVGILSALPGELGALRTSATSEFEVGGLRMLRLEFSGVPAVACVGGVGKVFAARAAALLLEAAPRGLLIVGVCGGLHRSLVPGTFVHCERAVQRDLYSGPGRVSEPTPAWSAAWQSVCPGERATFLTADRAVFSSLRARWITRNVSGLAVAEMETAAAAAVAMAANKPWAALRVVSDQPALFDRKGFERNYREVAGRAAETLLELAPNLPD